MTWYMRIGTEAVPGLPVGVPVTVECGVVVDAEGDVFDGGRL
jgi:hypothetical protein